MQILAKIVHNTSLPPHHQYSQDLVPRDFRLFPELKNSLKGTYFEPVEGVKTTIQALKVYRTKGFPILFRQTENKNGAMRQT